MFANHGTTLFRRVLATSNPTAFGARAFQAGSGASGLTPFHLAFPVRDLEKARAFYGKTLGCRQGRELKGCWIDFDLFGHQIVCKYFLFVSGHQMQDLSAANVVSRNQVDSHKVPVPHFGIVLEWALFHRWAAHLEKQNGFSFEIAPTVRFKGLPGEQSTMFFLDPSGNALEFKTFKDPSKLFATE
ncbi:Glyoxalase/Bleomycin resistance protein/Dihydroxybiphenyl dioxygenase [Chytriomyces sp. MP71]|nr:Glyoxalase/Bleomycin resistance protein/Dihydroxybiphenyl dioxygenase [Chytriomyces sp. MP71]